MALYTPSFGIEFSDVHANDLYSLGHDALHLPDRVMRACHVLVWNHGAAGPEADTDDGLLVLVEPVKHILDSLDLAHEPLGVLAGEEQSLVLSRVSFLEVRVQDLHLPLGDEPAVLRVLSDGG